MAGKPLRSVSRQPIQAGDIFGHWTVVSLGEPDKRGQTRWNCRCSCGTERPVFAMVLKRGGSKSCGCVTAKLIKAAKTKHGLSDIPEHSHWCNMRNRCKNNPTYHGRYICSRWYESFAAFYADLGPKPAPNYTLERIDDKGNYTCGQCEDCLNRGDTMNCRWATFKEQMRNTRRSHFVTFNGRTATIGEWAEIFSVSYSSMYWRVSSGKNPDGSLISEKPSSA